MSPTRYGWAYWIAKCKHVEGEEYLSQELLSDINLPTILPPPPPPPPRSNLAPFAIKVFAEYNAPEWILNDSGVWLLLSTASMRLKSLSNIEIKHPIYSLTAAKWARVLFSLSLLDNNICSLVPFDLLISLTTSANVFLPCLSCFCNLLIITFPWFPC